MFSFLLAMLNSFLGLAYMLVERSLTFFHSCYSDCLIGSQTVNIRKMTQSSEGVCISVIPAESEREREISHDSISACNMQSQGCYGLCNKQTV